MTAKLLPNERLNAIKRVKSGENVSSVCKELGISRTLFYRWLKRYKEKKFYALIPKGNLPPNWEPYEKLSPKNRLLMIERVKAGEPVVKVCRLYKVSRPVFYKWLKRYDSAPEGQKLEALWDQKPKIERYYNQTPEEYEQSVLAAVRQYPELSSHKLVWVLPRIGDRPVLGNHGVQNVLRRYNLTTYNRRLAYSQAYHRPTPLTQFFGIFQSLLAGTFAQTLSVRRTIVKGSIGFGIFLFLSLVLLGARQLFGVFGGGIIVSMGTIFSLISLLLGMFFFMYSLKYYITIAMVLSFSRQGKEGEKEEKKQSFLAKLFGVSISVEPKSGFAKENGFGGYHGGGGLQADLSNIILERKPFVSIHLATYNEKRVIDRLLTAATSQHYENYEVVIVDDSTDETREILKKWEKHPRVKVIKRETRQGFKGAALKKALENTDQKAEFVIVFDADFIPYPDTIVQFLKYFQSVAGTLDFSKKKMATWPNGQMAKNHSTIQPFSNSHRIAAIQGYQWHVLNKSENWVTRGVRTEYAGSYVIERSATEIYSGLKQIAGSVYMIRRDVLSEIGWGTSITEDFQLTLKLYSKGYKVVYTPYIQAPAEAVSTIKRLIRQRMRWAEGHSYNIRKMFKELMFGRWENPSNNHSTIQPFNHSKLNSYIAKWLHGQKKEGEVFQPSPLTTAEKVEVLYLTPYYLQALLFMAGTFFWFMAEAVFKVTLPFWTEVWGWSLVFTNLFALPLMNLVGLFLEESEEKDYIGLFSFIVLSYLVAPFQGYAALKGFLEKEEGPWFRTPKTGRITDVFTPGRFYKKIFGWLGRPSPVVQMADQSNLSPYLAKTGSAYFAPATAHNVFNRFHIPRKKVRYLVRIVTVVLAFSSILLSLFPSTVELGRSDGGYKWVESRERIDFGATDIPKILIPIKKEEKAGIFTFLIKPSYASFENFGVEIFLNGKKADDLKTEAKKQNNGEMLVKVLPTGNVKPGKYTIEYRYVTNKKTYVGRQDFTWGVLAVNTNKSVYLPNEKALLSFAVLDEQGKIVCNASLNLKIRAPNKNKEETISTKDGKIKVNKECFSHEVTDKPDYEAEYQVGQKGKYQMELTAETGRGAYTIHDNFEVRESVPFVVERKLATRIYPPNNYPVALMIQANDDFNGVIQEKVPENFRVLTFEKQRPYSKIEVEGNSQKITWNVFLKKGEKINLGYQFKAPDISPELYLIGPLTFRKGQDTVFTETRNWQIAADVVFPSTSYLSSTASTKITGTTSWQIITTANSSSNVTTKEQHKKTTGYTQWKPGVTNGTNAQSKPTAPNGLGFIYDTALTSQITSGTWTFNLKTTNSSATGTGYATVCAWKVRVSGGAITSSVNFINCVDGTTNLQANTTGLYVSSVSVASVPAISFMSDEYLYVEYWLHTTVAGTSATGNILFEANTSNDSIVTPGSSATATPSIASLIQYDATHAGVISTGVNTTSGITDSLYLDFDATSLDLTETFTPKVEVRDTSTSFTNVVTQTGTAMYYDASEPVRRRGHSAIYDSQNKRMVVFGGTKDGTTKYNDVWVLPIPTTNNPKTQWRKLDPTGTPPAARSFHSAIYDSTNARMILFGGNTTVDTNEVWKLTLPTSGDGAWTQLSPGGTPPSIRSNTDAIYDSPNNRMVVFGGWGASRYNDTWELSLTSGSETWTERNPSGSAPSIRGDYCATYDSSRSNYVIFGGYNGTSSFNDVYFLNVATPGSESWTTLSPGGTLPSQRSHCETIYDSANSRMILYMGWNSTTYYDDTWELTLAAGSETWTEKSPPAGSRQRATRSMAGIYDATNQKMMVFGGEDATVGSHRHVLYFSLPSSGNFTYNGISLLSRLQGEDAMSYLYDSFNKRMVIFGGFGRITDNADIDSGVHLNEAWAYSPASNTWQDINYASSGPTDREGAVAVYDSANKRMIAFGGLTGHLSAATDRYYNDVWELTLPATTSANPVWRKLSPSGTAPSTRWLASAVYDSLNQRLVLFGGENETGVLNDTWELTLPASGDGVWTQLSPGGTPPVGRAQSASIYDSANQRMLIFGGGKLTGVPLAYYDDVYELSLTSGSEAWTDRTPASGPTARRGTTCIYDNAFAEKRMVCFGGYKGSSHFSEVWKLNVTTSGSEAWTQVTPGGMGANGRRSHGAAYDSVNQKMIVYGGRTTNPPFYNDTWAISLESSTSSWTWSNLDPTIQVRVSAPVTGLTQGASYHWQGWTTGSNSGDGTKVSYGGNLETAADFVIIPEKVLIFLLFVALFPKMAKKMKQRRQSGG